MPGIYWRKDECLRKHLPTITRLVRSGAATRAGMWSFIRVVGRQMCPDLSRTTSRLCESLIARLLQRRLD